MPLRRLLRNPADARPRRLDDVPDAVPADVTTAERPGLVHVKVDAPARAEGPDGAIDAGDGSGHVDLTGGTRVTARPRTRPAACRLARTAAIVAFAALLWGGAVRAAAAAQPGDPAEVVERVDAVVIEVMREAETLGYRGRLERLEPVLRSSFDFPQMARVAVGRHWQELNEAQRDRLVEGFAELSIATFAARFDGYSGQRFDIVGTRPGLRGAVLVDNRLVKPSGESTNIDYVLRSGDEGVWRIVDVYLESKYSELAMKRAEYTSVLRRHGFDDLMRRIEAEIADLAAGNTS